MLRRAGAEAADLFMAMTEGDNRNVMAAQLATEALGARQVIAKINDPLRASAYAELGIATLCRTNLMANAVMRLPRPRPDVRPGLSRGHRPAPGRRAPRPTTPAWPGSRRPPAPVVPGGAAPAAAASPSFPPRPAVAAPADPTRRRSRPVSAREG